LILDTNLSNKDTRAKLRITDQGSEPIFMRL